MYADSEYTGAGVMDGGGDAIKACPSNANTSELYLFLLNVSL